MGSGGVWEWGWVVYEVVFGFEACFSGGFLCGSKGIWDVFSIVRLNFFGLLVCNEFSTMLGDIYN